MAASLWVAFGVGLLVGLWAEEAEGAEQRPTGCLRRWGCCVQSWLSCWG